MCCGRPRFASADSPDCHCPTTLPARISPPRGLPLAWIIPCCRAEQEYPVHLATVVRRAGIPPSDAAVRAMRTAADLFDAADDLAGLVQRASTALASEPGEMCLVSLTDAEVLRPVAVAHQRPSAARALRRIV